MSLGGGTWLVQNKVLPGAYINFVSLQKANATLSDRGVVALPIELDWGTDDVLFMTNDEFQTDSFKKLGYAYTDDKLKGLRDLFINAKEVYFIRLNTGGTKASAKNESSEKLIEAAYTGVRGNDLKVVVEADVDIAGNFVFSTYLAGVLVDTQSVSTVADLEDNGYVVFSDKLPLSANAGYVLTGGTNGTTDGLSHQNALDRMEQLSFNTTAYIGKEETIQRLYATYTKRMRDEVGAKFQCVLYNFKGDYEGIINVKNSVTDKGANEYDLLYWVLGAEAGCAINKDLTNSVYDGEYTVKADYTQTELKQAIKAGELTFHKVGDDVRVLDDINSFTSWTVEKNQDFCSNQTIRVIDNWANDVALIFNQRYLGKIQNDKLGRIAFKNELVDYAMQLQDIRAIENVDEENDFTVLEGKTKNDVLVYAMLQIVGVMKKLYMQVTIA